MHLFLGLVLTRSQLQMLTQARNTVCTHIHTAARFGCCSVSVAGGMIPTHHHAHMFVIFKRDGKDQINQREAAGDAKGSLSQQWSQQHCGRNRDVCLWRYYSIECCFVRFVSPLYQHSLP